jgi:hypothetical protein
MRDNLGDIIIALLGLVVVLFITSGVSPHDVPRPLRFKLCTLLGVIALVAVVMG